MRPVAGQSTEIFKAKLLPSGKRLRITNAVRLVTHTYEQSQDSGVNAYRAMQDAKYFTWASNSTDPFSYKLPSRRLAMALFFVRFPDLLILRACLCRVPTMRIRGGQHHIPSSRPRTVSSYAMARELRTKCC